MNRSHQTKYEEAQVCDTNIKYDNHRVRYLPIFKYMIRRNKYLNIAKSLTITNKTHTVTYTDNTCITDILLHRHRRPLPPVHRGVVAVTADLPPPHQIHLCITLTVSLPSVTDANTDSDALYSGEPVSDSCIPSLRRQC